MRHLCVILHRYVGLAMALFLVVAGLTGSLLVFNHELDALINPRLMHVAPPGEDVQPIDPLVLRERLQRSLPDVAVTYVPLSREPHESVHFWVEPAEEAEAAQLPDDEYFVDPYTGEVLGSRRWGDISQGVKNVMPFVYKLHYTLALGTVGSYLFGVIALLWTIDCFVGAYLTFPVAPRKTKGTDASRASRSPSKSWWAQWGKAWLFKTGSLYKLTFTWHRASGLWVWALLFVFAWSAVGLNLHEVYQPVMNAAFGMQERAYRTLPSLESPRTTPELSWQEALASGRALMADAAQEGGFEIAKESRISYDPAKGTYQYVVHSSRDVATRWGGTRMWLDGNTGERVAFEAPTGQALGNTITSWIYAMHFAAVWGMPFRIFICVTGVLIAVLSVSGVYIWWVKRQSRRRMAQRGRSAQTQPRVETVTSAESATSNPGSAVTEPASQAAAEETRPVLSR